MSYLDTVKYRVNYFCIILNIIRCGTEPSTDNCAKPIAKSFTLLTVICRRQQFL